MQAAMEITRVDQGGCSELLVSGRLDGYWSRHLMEAIDELMREGMHRARLNLSNANYISSAGIRVLLQAFQQFSAVGGALWVVEPSSAVRQVLDLAGLAETLCAPPLEQKLAASAESVTQHYEESGCSFELHDLRPSARLLCGAVGRPELLPVAAFGNENAQLLPLPSDVFALGLGAFGDTYDACRDRFGEFLAVAGCAACQPTEETGCADYMVSSGGLVPRIVTLYHLFCRGEFAKLLRFESGLGTGQVGLGSVIAACMAAAGSPAAGIVLLAESSGLLGVSLKRSPANGGAGGLFHHPEVRNWLSFSPMRSYTRSVAVIAGVAAQFPAPPGLVPLLRPLKTASGLAGHFHAAAFGYHPLRKGYIDLKTTLRHLFDTGGLQGVVHLLTDDRPGAGVGESEFTRGACWIGPLDMIESQEKTL